MLGDTAVAVHPDDPRYADLVGKKVVLPLTNRHIPVIADTYVDRDYGTGAVKITPAHDQNDYELGERHGIPLVSIIGFDGKLTAEAGEKYQGMTVDEARKQVLIDLEQQGLRRGETKIVHTVSHCYKCGSVIEPLLKEQWFVSVKPLAERAIEAIRNNEIKFTPKSKKQVLINYYKKLRDWNISRQIPWGIPIPAFRNIADDTDWIYSTEVDKKHLDIDGKRYLRDEDTFDTWFSSGQWPAIVTSPRPEFYPTSVMETGIDLIFAWVSRMIMLGLYVKDEVPFKEVYFHGLVLDEHGIKMSKSKGNVINPMAIVSEYGSDALRLGLIANRSAAQPQAFSTAAVVAGRNLCNKLWNIARFVQNIVDESGDTFDANLHDAPQLHFTKVKATNMGEDWIIREIEEAEEKVEKLIKEYRFAEAQELIYDLIWNRYADWFLESQKIFKNIPLLKKSLEHLVLMLHPFAPFLTESIWQSLSWTWGMAIAQGMPGKLDFSPAKAAEFDDLKVIISEVRKTLTALQLPNKPTLYYRDDSVIEGDQLLVRSLARVAAVTHTDQPIGKRLALHDHEAYLDIPDKAIKAHRKALEARILSLGKEIDTLNARLDNPSYIGKAPAKLVQQTKDTLAEKQVVLKRLEDELGQN